MQKKKKKKVITKQIENFPNRFNEAYLNKSSYSRILCVFHYSLPFVGLTCFIARHRSIIIRLKEIWEIIPQEKET